MFLAPERQVLLPRGLADEQGQRHRLVALRPFTGREEALLAAQAADNRAALLTSLLAACVARIGGYRAVGREHVAALSRGDRQLLALALRADLFGAALPLVLTCASPACRARADLELDLEQLIPAAPPEAPEQIEVETSLGRAVLREPTGEDDEALAQAAHDTRAARAALLWSRLLVSLGDGGPLPPQEWSQLPAAVRQALALALAEQGSAPDLAFVSRCPTCAAFIEFELDPVELLGRELRLGADRLAAEVHCLAWSYGWSERDILDLPRTRRWQYLELVGRQVAGRPLLESWSV